MFRFLFIIIVSFGLQNVGFIFATDLHEQEKKMAVLLQQIYNSKSDSEKDSINQQLMILLRTFLTDQATFNHPFDSVPHIGILYSPDKIFRLYNWNLQWNDGTFTYYAFIQYRFKRNEILLIELTDKSEQINDPEYQTLKAGEWFGVLYYQIIKVDQDSPPYYILLGWDGNNDFSKKKVIEVLYFNAKGEPQFGKPIFKGDKPKIKRVIFEYSYLANMTLQYNDDLKMIIFDHLAPPKPSLTGQYRFYGPDFSYDAYQLIKGKWEYKKNVDARNPKKGHKK